LGDRLLWKKLKNYKHKWPYFVGTFFTENFEY
jgi:hypothetical protein